MKGRRLYYRRKDKSIIIEGKRDDKSIFIWTLPNPEDLILNLIEKSSYFTQEKAAIIKEKIERLDIREDKPIKELDKVRLPIIKRTSEKDEEVIEKPTEEDIRKLWDITKE